MSLSVKQKEVISLMRDGYSLKYQNKFSCSWWLTKSLGSGRNHILDIRKATFNKLLDGNYITISHVDGFNHHYYKLTELGKNIDVTQPIETKD
ncbi:MAG TPA: hypothetical protein PK431_13980 [Chitinophagales bacterium]|nr:hypothetical protein [Chitinophagales bacterium]